MPRQPSGMTVDNGVILSIGMFSLTEALEIVMPMATESTTMDGTNRCGDCVQSFIDAESADLQNIISVGTYITFIQAQGMTPGSIPFRQPFTATDLPGQRTGTPLPTQCAALGIYYEDPEDVPTGSKIRVGKTFFGGISQEDVIENVLVNALITAIQTFTQAMQAGYPSELDLSSKWYRVVAAPRSGSGSTTINRSFSAGSRGGIYTQRRRLLPRLS